MEYDCQTVAIDKLPVLETGISEPLCSDCASPDCTNPIREVSISRFGIPMKARMWVVNRVIRQVVACKGYVGDQNVQTNLSPRSS